MTDGPDPLPGFLAAAFASAVATSLYMVFAEPMPAGNAAFAGLAFTAALFIAALHIVFLALPLHALLSRDGAPRPGIVLASATLIGALPIPLLFRGDASAFVIFGLAGLVGGVAFLLVTGRPGARGEDE